MTAAAATTTETPGWLKQNLTWQGFALGLVLVAVAYGALAGWIWYSAPALRQARIDKIPSLTVIIEHPVAVPKTDELYGPFPETVYGPQQTETGENHETELPATEPENAALPLAPPDALPAAPIKGLYEETPQGRLPVVRRSDGTTAFKAYRRPFDLQGIGTKPIISIAVADIGLSNVASETAVRTLPPDISFIVSPFSPNPDFWINESRARGHEIWLTLPTETRNYPMDDPGPQTLLIGVPEQQNQIKMSWIMGRAVGYAGFVSNYQSAFLQSANDTRPVIGAIYNRGLGFIDTSANPAMLPQTMAAGMNAPYGAAGIWADAEPSPEQIQGSFKKIEEIAREHGRAAGIIHPLPVSFQELQTWLDSLPGKGFVLAPLSAQTGF